VRNHGECSDATLATADVMQNDAAKFRAKRKAP
jgi:hypothetical protein